ncbi:MAG: hypothetical protein MI861_22430, partial [Pirellulales bacterium]|nr:hypothetical protein [Pirellulales bacterium]
PPTPTGVSFAGLKWVDWQETDQNFQVTTWVGDQDLLAKTRSGASLPVGDLKIGRYCELEGQRTSLATLDGGAPLFAKALTDNHNIYFCSTTTALADSSLARDGVVLYAIVQRGLELGAASLGNTRQVVAGDLDDQDTSQWKQVAGDPGTLSNRYSAQAGVYGEEDRLLAINRGDKEDVAAVLTNERVASLFDGLDFRRIDETVGSGSSLIREIWRVFLQLMMVALVAEAILCIPRKAASGQSDSFFATEGTAA